MRRIGWALTRHGEHVLRERQVEATEAEIDRVAREEGAERSVIVARGCDGRWHATGVPRTRRLRNARRIAA